MKFISREQFPLQSQTFYIVARDMVSMQEWLIGPRGIKLCFMQVCMLSFWCFGCVAGSMTTLLGLLDPDDAGSMFL
jgi:hypothetical protein